MSSQRRGEVGRRMPQLESASKVRGRALYTPDIALPNMLHAAVLRSPHAHARIESISTADASAMPGVQAVITAADFPGIKYVHLGAKWSDRYPMARDRVRFFGEEVAAVAAETPSLARAAAARIQVAYVPLPAALDPDAATRSDALPIHEGELTQAGKNVAQRVSTDFGDVESAFSRAAHVFEDEFEHGVVVPGCMETNGTVAAYDAESGVLTLWTATQAPFFVRKEVAHVLGLDVSRVRIRSVEVGGGFGGKSKVCEQEAIAALLSIRTGRPVKLILDRQEEFWSGKTDHAKRIRIRTAIDEAGRILCRSTRLTINNGAYTAFGPIYTGVGRQRAVSLYRIGSAHFESTLVYTNRVPGGQYRGMGGPHVIWAIETQLDEIADRLGIDPLDYRIALANRQGDETPLGWKFNSCAMTACIEEVGKRFGWKEKRANPEPWRGIGISAFSHPSGGVFYEEGNFSNTRIRLEATGEIRVFTMTADSGTWQNTIIAQLVADVLGVPTERIAVTHMDTEAAPTDLGSAASRVTFVTGNAAVRAAELLRRTVVEKLSEVWNCPESEIRLDGGTASHGDHESHRITIDEFARRYGPVQCDGYYTVPRSRADSKTGHGDYAAAYVFGAHAAEVEVDPQTGRIKVLRVVAAQDVGKAINPTAIEGQIHGGILQSIGIALQEELVYEDGRPVNASFLDYRIPRIGDAPPIEVAILESDEREGPFGAKAAGEPAINCAAAAIANAVFRAIGVRFKRLPITPAMVLEALAERESRKLDFKPQARPFNAEVATVRALYPKLVFPALRRLNAKVRREPPKASMPTVLQPASLDELVAELAVPKRTAKIQAGGTDLTVGLRQGIYRTDVILETSRIDALKGIRGVGDVLHIGAGDVLADVAGSDAVGRVAPMLVEGIELIATPQIRNVATVAGDLAQEKRCWFFRSALPCYKNAGPTAPCFAVLGDNRHHSIMGARRCAAPCPADLAPMLTALDATVVAASLNGERRISMEDFYVWSGRTSVEPHEVILRIEVPVRADSTQAFEKFALRQGDFAEASAAVSLDWQQGSLVGARVALGGVAPLPMRARETERHLLEHWRSKDGVRSAALKSVFGSLPLSRNAHKVELTVNLVERAIATAIDRAARNASRDTAPRLVRSIDRAAESAPVQ